MTSSDLCCIVHTPLAESEAQRIADLLKAMADPTRLRILSMIAAAPSGELCACDLPEAIGKSQPTISHHLHQLTTAGLIHREQRGKWAWFRLEPDRLAELRTCLGDDCC